MRYVEPPKAARKLNKSHISIVLTLVIRYFCSFQKSFLKKKGSWKFLFFNISEFFGRKLCLTKVPRPRRAVISSLLCKRVFDYEQSTRFYRKPHERRLQRRIYSAHKSRLTFTAIEHLGTIIREENALRHAEDLKQTITSSNAVWPGGYSNGLGRGKNCVVFPYVRPTFVGISRRSWFLRCCRFIIRLPRPYCTPSGRMRIPRNRTNVKGWEQHYIIIVLSRLRRSRVRTNVVILLRFIRCPFRQKKKKRITPAR